MFQLTYILYILPFANLFTGFSMLITECSSNSRYLTYLDLNGFSLSFASYPVWYFMKLITLSREKLDDAFNAIAKR